MMRSAFLLLLLCLAITSQGQSIPDNWGRASWTVLHGDDSLNHAWTGGLTAPQWSPFDADLDGDEDLLAFDRDGNRILVFERLPNGDLTVNWEWASGFPEMVDWCLLRDYNCDGKADIFTSHMNGILVFENTTVAGGAPSFSTAPSDLTASFDFGSGASELPVICIGMDLPAIMDHDDDGDLDIITFTETATTLYHFQGQSPCGLELTCTNRCYGMLEEAAENNALFIGDDFECSFNVAEPGLVGTEVNRTGITQGGALTSLQLEAGGPKDLLVSDVTYHTTIGVVMESSSSGLDSAVFLDTEFPANLWGDQAVNLPRFPAAFHLDVDLDGTKDLIFSPNATWETDDDAGVHWFKNTGSEDAPLWAFQDNAYLQRDMIDMGRGAYPVLMDFDGDGLIDLAIANKERHEGIGQTPAFVVSYRNVGSPGQPCFDKVNDDWIPLSTFQIESAYPAFGDLDGDGDLDVVVGDELGLLHRFDNVAGAGEWPSFEIAEISILDVGQFATPQLLDMDGDGDLDMVVGEKNGTLTLVEQDALGAWSVYNSPIHGETWGGLVVDNLLGINGYCVPALTETEEGLRVFVANEVGRVQDFGVFTGDWDADLVEVNDNVFNLQPGFRAAAAFADLNQDGFMDGLVGIQNGGVLAFYGDADEAAGCTDAAACNYSPVATEDDSSCIYMDALGACGGECLEDEDDDAICDDVDECIGAMDECGECNGPGEVYECGCVEIPDGACDCDGNVLDAVDVCGGFCLEDDDDNGVCDDQEIYGCTYPLAENFSSSVTRDDGSCIFPCEGAVNINVFDWDEDYAVTIADFLAMLSVFGDVDVDSDGVWDSSDLCVDINACNYANDPSEPCGYIDVLGICGGGCEADEDNDGVCDDIDSCIGVEDECGVCNGPGPTEVVIEDITILYDSVYAEQIDQWFVFEVGTDTTFSYTCAPSFSTCGDPVSYQGYDYATVLIGDQCWFAENLRSENYENGDAIPSNLSNSEWSSTFSGAMTVFGEGGSTCYEFSPDGDPCDAAFSLSEYGRLYNWYAVGDARGLCPNSWHVPSDEEWTVMTNALGGADSAGIKIKATFGWYNGGNGTNSSGFSGLPGGYRAPNATMFNSSGSHGYFWSSSPVGSNSWYRHLSYNVDYYNNSPVYRENIHGRRAGFSIRCIQDQE